jgi:flagellar biosynthesis/type III secretory pathway chaperone
MATETRDTYITDIEEPLLIRLLFTLEEMVKRYQKLLSVLQREKGLMIEGNLNDLIPCLNDKEALLAELKELEDRRLREIDPLARRLQMTARSEEGVSLRQLIGVVSLPYRGRLISCYDRLRALLSSVTEINQINGLLVGRILQQVNGLLGLLTHLSTAPQTYQATGSFSHDFQSGRALRPTGALHIRG